jgi:hypothetical protein
VSVPTPYQSLQRPSTINSSVGIWIRVPEPFLQNLLLQGGDAPTSFDVRVVDRIDGGGARLVGCLQRETGLGKNDAWLIERVSEMQFVPTRRSSVALGSAAGCRIAGVGQHKRRSIRTGTRSAYAPSRCPDQQLLRKYDTIERALAPCQSYGPLCALLWMAQQWLNPRCVVISYPCPCVQPLPLRPQSARLRLLY